MRTLEQLVEALRQPGVSRLATITFEYSEGMARLRKPTSITLQELQALAHAAFPEAERILGRVTCARCHAEVTIGTPHDCPRKRRTLHG